MGNNVLLYLSFFLFFSEGDLASNVIRIIGDKDTVKLIDEHVVSTEYDLENYDMRDVYWENVVFENCVFKNIPALRQAYLRGVSFINCEVDSLSIWDSEIDSLMILNSEFNHLDIHTSRIGEIELRGGECKSVIFKNSTINRAVFSLFSYQKISLTSSFFSLIRLKSLDGLIKSFTVEGCELSVIDFDLNYLRNLDLSSIIIDPYQPIVYEEGCNREFRKNVRSSVISQYLAILGNSTVRQNEILEKSAEYNRLRIRQKDSSILTQFYHKYVKSGYGYRPVYGLVTLGVIVVGFSFIYFLMGLIHFCWSAKSKLGLVVERASTSESTISIIHPKSYSSVISYAIDCFVFSVDRSLYFAVRPLGIHGATKLLRLRPISFIPVGYGRLISLLQSVTSAIVIVYIISSFLRVI